MEDSQIDGSPRTQFGALPYRWTKDGELEVMLVTSRETRRWVIPKGWPMKKLKPFAAAKREAYEEAGLTGHVGKRPIGSFTYQKRLKTRDVVPCRVEVFLLDVQRQAKRWPERKERECQWFLPDEAAERVDEPELADLIRALPDVLGKAGVGPTLAQAAAG